MADSYKQSFDIKFGFVFGESDSKLSITLPNPKVPEDVKPLLANVESLAVDNRLLIGKVYSENVSKLDDVVITAKSETGLDWR